MLFVVYEKLGATVLSMAVSPCVFSVTTAVVRVTAVTGYFSCSIVDLFRKR